MNGLIYRVFKVYEVCAYLLANRGDVVVFRVEWKV